MVCRRDVGWFRPELPPTTSEPNRGIGSANVKRALHRQHWPSCMVRSSRTSPKSDSKATPKIIRDSRATIVGVRAGEFFLFFFENLMLDCMHKFRARSHKISTLCKISTPSSRYGFSHDLHVFFFDVHVENTGMTLAFRLAWSVLRA